MFALRVAAIIVALLMTVGPGVCGGYCFFMGMRGVLAVPPQQWSGAFAIIGFASLIVAGLSAWAIRYQLRKIREERDE